MPKLSAFGSAFAAARKSGKKTFMFRGKSYNTKLASDIKLPKNAPTPTARPSGNKNAAGAAAAARRSKDTGMQGGKGPKNRASGTSMQGGKGPKTRVSGRPKNVVQKHSTAGATYRPVVPQGR